jgi:hypothetical protein
MHVVELSRIEEGTRDELIASNRTDETGHSINKRVLFWNLAFCKFALKLSHSCIYESKMRWRSIGLRCHRQRYIAVYPSVSAA